MRHEIDVLAIGNAIMDVIAPVKDTFLTDYDMNKGAMMLIDEPRAVALNTALATVAQINEIAGGSAGNTMVGIAELGLRGHYIAKVGRDDMGERLADGYRDAGLCFDTPSATSGTATARCLIAVTEDGERTMNTFLGCSTEFGVKDVRRQDIERAATLYLEGYLFDRDDAKKAFVRAAEMAQAAKRTVALTLSDSFCVDRHRASFRQIVDHHVDILFANEDELLSLYQTDRLDTALDALTSTKSVACVTRGEKGSIIQTPERRYLVPAAPIHKVVDTTGAGDQYAAGVLAGRAMNMDWADAGYLGSIAAAEVIQHYGARPEHPIHNIAVATS